MFGKAAPEGYKGAYWGARAIYTPAKYKEVLKRVKGRSKYKYEKIECVVDLLPDRQSVSGDEEKVKALVAWLNTKALTELRKTLDDKWTAPSSRDVIEIESEDGRYHLEASPNASYGYLYIGAWEKE